MNNTDKKRPIREGKTAKDRASGATERRLANRAARDSWQKGQSPFPKLACNGKKNRSNFTGKSNKKVFL